MVIGDTSTLKGPGDVAQGIHYNYLETRPPIVTNIWSSGSGYCAGAGSAAINGLFPREPWVDPFTTYEITVHYENTGATTPDHDGVIRFDLESDPWVAGPTGTFVDLVARAGPTTQWGSVTGDLTIDTAQSLDVIRMWVINGASGSVRVQSCEIRPKAPTVVAAGSISVNSRDFVPHDSTEFDANSGLSVHQVQAMVDNLEHIRHVRKPTYAAISDNPVRATPLWTTSSSTYVQIMAPIPITTGRGETRIHWALYGYCAVAGSVKLELLKAQSEQEITLQTTWSSPYTAAKETYADGGQSHLTALEDKADELRVYLKGDGSNAAHLYALCVWGGVT